MRKRRLILAGVAALLAVNVSLWLATFGLALPRSLPAFFFGPGLVRAEIVMLQDGVVRDYLVDRGRVRAKTRTSLTLRERDGTMVTIPVAIEATILVNGRVATIAQIRRGMVVTTVREGDGGAIDVRATG
jgi:hypothetical protein